MWCCAYKEGYPNYTVRVFGVWETLDEAVEAVLAKITASVPDFDQEIAKEKLRGPKHTCCTNLAAWYLRIVE